MDSIVNTINGKTFGTFKFQYSRHHPVHPDPRLVPPNNKRLAEEILTYFFCEFRKRKFKSIISDIEISKDDSNKKPDALITENGVRKGIQITQLQFTNHEARKAIANDLNKQIADSLSLSLTCPLRVIINIFPAINKSLIPLKDIRKGKAKIISSLISFISQSLHAKLQTLSEDSSPSYTFIDTGLLKPHFSHIVFNPVPKGAYPRFYGRKNIYVNMDMNDTSYDLNDLDDAINEIYKKKNNGLSEVLLIWADEQELALNKRPAAERIFSKFIASSFKEVYFMTFQNNVALFEKSLELWQLKPFADNIPPLKK